LPAGPPSYAPACWIIARLLSRPPCGGRQKPAQKRRTASATAEAPNCRSATAVLQGHLGAISGGILREDSRRTLFPSRAATAGRGPRRIARPRHCRASTPIGPVPPEMCRVEHHRRPPTPLGGLPSRSIPGSE
jgi:hypothetical protein